MESKHWYSLVFLVFAGISIYIGDDAGFWGSLIISTIYNKS